MPTKLSDQELEEKLAPLLEGHKVYYEWWRAMAMAGKPLPPGGVAAITPTLVLEHSLGDLRAAISYALQVPLGVVRIRLDSDDAGRPLPIVDVGHSPDLRKLVRRMANTNTEEELQVALQQHVATVNKIVYHEWLGHLTIRLDSCAKVRADLMPAKIEDMLDAPY